MNKFYKGLCISMSAVLALSPMSCLALTKDETVYTKLNTNGSIKKTTVTDHLLNDDNDTIKDYSDLQDILNVNGEEKFTNNNGTLTWNALGNDIYYQGTTNKELPISIKASYYLDGEETTVKKMLGKKGHVTIKLNYTNNEKHIVGGNLMYTPFVVATGTIISSKNNSDITVTNGKVVNNGTSDVIVSIAAPGLSESLGLDNMDDLDETTIEYDTTKFSLASIYTVATPKILDSDSLKVFDKLDSLYSSIDELSSASKQLVSGADTLNQGLITYNSKFSEYNTGVNKLNAGSKELVAGNNKINTGLNTLNSSLSNLSVLTSKINDLVTAVNALSAGSNNLNTMASAKLDEASVSITNMKAALISHITNLSTIAATTTDPATQASLNAEINGLQTQLASLDLDTLNTNILTLKGGINELNTNINNLNTSVSAMPASIAPLFSQLTSGVSELKNGSNTFTTGLNTFDSSIDTLTNATGQLNDGTKQLVEGSTTLSEGMKKFDNDGISKLTDFINNNVKTVTAKIKELTNLSEEYKTFTKIDNNTEGNVKFIMIIDAKE